MAAAAEGVAAAVAPAAADEPGVLVVEVKATYDGNIIALIQLPPQSWGTTIDEVKAEVTTYLPVYANRLVSNSIACPFRVSCSHS